MHDIASALGVQIDPAEEDCKERSSKTGQPGEGGSEQQQHSHASMPKQGSSIFQAGVSYVKSVVFGIGEEAGVDEGEHQKPDDISVPTEEESVELHRAKANVKQLQSALKYSEKCF